MQKDDQDDMNITTSKTGRKKPAYSGGLVLEPKKGLNLRFVSVGLKQAEMSRITKIPYYIF